MKIDLEITARTKHAIKWIALPFAVLAGSAAVAHAWTADTTWISPAKPVSAGSLKALFDEADARLKALETAKPKFVGKKSSWSLTADYCGLTTTSFSGAIGSAPNGFLAAHDACATACVSASAHMCLASELIRHVQTGGDALPGTSGRWAWIASGAAATASASTFNQDCLGYSTTNGGYAGTVWDTSLSSTSVAPCAESHAIACCD